MKFDEFIKQETESDEERLSAQKTKMREDYLRYVDELYSDVKRILDKYIRASQVSVKEEEFAITEEFLGTYSAKRMTIYLGNHGKYVRLTPIGADVIGAYGRVDMSGNNGTLRIVLVNEKLTEPRIRVTVRISGTKDSAQETPQPEPTLKWRFATNPPHIRYIPIDDETFLESVMQLA